MGVLFRAAPKKWPLLGYQHFFPRLKSSKTMWKRPRQALWVTPHRRFFTVFLVQLTYAQGNRMYVGAEHDSRGAGISELDKTKIIYKL